MIHGNNPLFSFPIDFKFKEIQKVKIVPIEMDKTAEKGYEVYTAFYILIHDRDSLKIFKMYAYSPNKDQKYPT